MNIDTATDILARMREVATFKETQTAAERSAAAARLAGDFPDMPDDWALAWVREEIRRGARPTRAELGIAWNVTVQARIDAVVIPDAPAAVEANPIASAQWRRLFMHAVREGASTEEAFAYANASLGVDPDPVSPPVDPARVNALLAEVRGYGTSRTVGEGRDQ